MQARGKMRAETACTVIVFARVAGENLNTCTTGEDPVRLANVWSLA